MKFVTTFEDLEPYLDKLNTTKKEKEEIKKELLKLSFPLKFPKAYLDRITNINLIVDEIQETYGYPKGKTEVLSRYQKEILNIISPILPKPPIDITHLESYTKVVGVAKEDKEPIKGIVRVYKRRALLVPFGACAGHCLWCFREKTEFSLSEKEIKKVINWLKKHKEIYDVILTGGEPLMGSLEKIEQILKHLRNLNHIKIIRFHTRMPIYWPEKLDNKFFKMIKKYNTPKEGKSIWIVTQIVHPMELTGKTLEVIKKFLYVGIPVLNQAPVMHNINDHQRTFNELHDRMIFHGIKPYYDIALILTSDLSNIRFYVPLEKIQKLQKKYYLDGNGLGISKIIVPVMGKKYNPEELKEFEKKGAITRITKSQIYNKLKT